MTLASSAPLRALGQTADFAEAAAAETAEGTYGTTNGLGEALAFEGSVIVPGDFTYSATAENPAGEDTTIDFEHTLDLDAEPGFIYTGPSGGGFGVKFSGLDVSEGTIAPEATDSVVAAVVVNDEVVAFADEGYTAELDTETAVEFNLEAGTYVTLNEGDVVRVALVGGGEEVSDWDVAVGGAFMIY